MNARPDTAQAAPDAQLPAEFRSALQLAQAAVWDWHLSADHFQVDEAWIRAFGIDVPGGPMSLREWQRRIHPDDLGAFNAASDSCHHGSDRFECEYRLLAAGHRWLWVLHRGRVVLRERDAAAARITGLLLDQFLGHACHRPSLGQPRCRAGRGAADKPGRNGAAGYRLRGVPRGAATANRGLPRRCGAPAPHSGNGTCPAMRAPPAPCGSR